MFLGLSIFDWNIVSDIAGFVSVFAVGLVLNKLLHFKINIVMNFILKVFLPTTLIGLVLGVLANIGLGIPLTGVTLNTWSAIRAWLPYAGCCTAGFISGYLISPIVNLK